MSTILDFNWRISRFMAKKVNLKENVIYALSYVISHNLILVWGIIHNYLVNVLFCKWLSVVINVQVLCLLHTKPITGLYSTHDASVTHIIVYIAQTLDTRSDNLLTSMGERNKYVNLIIRNFIYITIPNLYKTFPYFASLFPNVSPDSMKICAQGKCGR